MVLAMVAAGSDLHAQISPGELSSAHAALEGVQKCTQCHTLGKAIGNDNCLNCHTELRNRIGARTGFHGVMGSKPCTQCHKEHHGRDFSIIRWDEKTFDHASIGFPLEGKHRSLQCRQCHIQKNVRAQDVAQNAVLVSHGTFLGLGRDCASCHRDPHGGALSQKCTTCHTNEAWKPAPGFSHAKTKYPLTGKHETVKCESCHSKNVNGTVKFQYEGLAFAKCSDCHKDPHEGKFKKSCDGCHSTAGWQGAVRGFDHSMTSYPLKAKHQQVQCEKCHGGAGQPGQKPGQRSFRIAKFQACSDCHANPHGQQFANRPDHGLCSSCHTERGWKERAMNGFDHARTRFPLRGKHADVACAICHVEAKQPRTGPMQINTKSFEHCSDCHADLHGGQFAARADKGACESCHRETGFRPAIYTVASHSESRFELTNAHTAVACDRCHAENATRGKKMRIFRWQKLVTCETCHKNVHGDQFAKWIADGCTTCHNTAGWNEARFDHKRTGFELTGKHIGVRCISCHKGVVNGVWQFSKSPRKCEDCHKGTVPGRL